MFNIHNHLSAKTALSFLLIAMMTFLAGCGENIPLTVKMHSTPTTNQSTIPIIPITAIDYGYEMPGNINVHAGLVDIAMVDNGTQPHQTQVARLKPGVTQSQVFNAFVTRNDQVAAFSQLTLIGGPDIVAPGYGQEAILSLSAGQYVLLCLVVGSDGVSHANKGMLHFFTVAKASAQVSDNVPHSDGRVIMTDSGYSLPSVITRPQSLTLQIINRGSEPHEMNIVKLSKGKSRQDVITFFQAPLGPPPFDETGGMAAMEASTAGWIKIHLDQGNYVALSFIPDKQTGKTQLTVGMITQFSVG